MSSGQTIGQASYTRAINRTLPSTITATGAKGTIKPVILKKVKKVKKMGWFKKKFNGWVRQAWESAQEECIDDTAVISRDVSVNARTSVRFTVYPASGGFVIEHYKQDRYRDSEGPELTIVNHGEELGKAVEHILAIEALRS